MRSSRLLVLLFGIGAKAVGCSTGMSPALAPSKILFERVSHDRTAFGATFWPYSGRGQQRPQTARSRRTNSPLELPEALRGKGQTSEGRRWRDLCRFYGSRLGPERLADEATRACLLNLIWVSLELERIRDAPAPQRPPVHNLLHMSQEQRVLLQQLGLSQLTRNNGDADDLRDHLRNGSDGVAP